VRWTFKVTTLPAITAATTTTLLACSLSLATRHAANGPIRMLCNRVSKLIYSIDTALNNVTRGICNNTNTVARKV
jgi:hypothetical protein